MIFLIKTRLLYGFFLNMRTLKVRMINEFVLVFNWFYCNIIKAHAVIFLYQT